MHTLFKQMHTSLDISAYNNPGYLMFISHKQDLLVGDVSGSVEDKLHLLFLMYDLDRTGYLSREAVATMIR